MVLENLNKPSLLNMKTVRKSLEFIVCFFYIISFLYLPNPVNKTHDKETLSQTAKAQAGLFRPQFKKTLDLGNVRTYPWGQDRFGGFEKFGEINDNSGTPRVIAVGYGSLWLFNSANDTWSQGPSYSCNTEEDGNIAVSFFQNRVLINRTGFTACEENYNAHLLYIYGFVNNSLVLTYSSPKPCSQLTDFDRGAYINDNGTCLVGRSKGPAYGPSSTVAGNVMYFGFFRPSSDENEASYSSIIKVTGFSDQTPIMTTLCRGNAICRSSSNLIGASNGQLFAFQLQLANNGHTVRNMLISLSTDPNDFNKVDTGVFYDVSRHNGGYFTVADSGNYFSDGKLRFAVVLHEGALTWSDGDCRSPETVQQVILTAAPNGVRGIDIKHSNVGARVPTGKCNNGTGYIYNGGGFAEANGSILYGFTSCYGDNGRRGNTWNDTSNVTACSDGTSGNGLLNFLDGSWQNVNMKGSEIENPNASDVRVISMYYSSTYRKLFAGIRNSHRAIGTMPNLVYRPGIWVHSFVPPIVNSCKNLLFNGNSTSGSVSPGSPNITIVNNGTSTNAAGQGFIDIVYGGTVYSRKYANGSVSNPENGTYSMSVSFNLENDLRALQNLGVAQAQVRVAIPGTGSYASESSCILNLGITSYSNPFVDGIMASCTTGQLLNPYRITFTMRALSSNFPGAQVTTIIVVLMPSNVVTNTPFEVGSNSPHGTKYVYVNNIMPTISADYSIENKSLTFSGSSPSAATFTFTVSFNPDSAYSEQYFLQNGFRYYAYVSDNTGRFSQLNGYTVGILSPLDQCSSLYYKTGNGDVRTLEPRSVPGTSSFNRILRVTSGQGINNQVNSDTRIRTSDYLYQGSSNLNTATCPNFTRLSSVPAFCQSVGTYLGTANGASPLGQITTNLLTAMSNPSVGKTTITGAGLPAWAIINWGNASLDIDISAIPVSDQQIYIVKIDNLPGGVNKVRTFDIAPRSGNVVIWCTIANCTMEISPVAITSNITINGNNQISFSTPYWSPYGNSYQHPYMYIHPYNLLYKSRLFVNTGTSGRTLLYSDPSNSNRVNIYLGGIVANNYFYTNTSRKTNVIKGFVYTKGVIARGNGVLSSNDNRSLTFRDFYDTTSGQPKPLLYVDYDPKYFFVYRNIFVRDAESVQKNLVGT